MLLSYNSLQVFHWSLSDSKSPHVRRTLLSIQTDLSSALDKMVSILPLISSSSSFYYFTHLRLFHTSVSWGLNDSKSPKVSRTLLRNLADLNNAVSLDGLHSSFYLQILQWLHQVHQLQLVSPSLSCSIVFSVL